MMNSAGLLLRYMLYFGVLAVCVSGRMSEIPDFIPGSALVSSIVMVMIFIAGAVSVMLGHARAVTYQRVFALSLCALVSVKLSPWPGMSMSGTYLPGHFHVLYFAVVLFAVSMGSFRHGLLSYFVIAVGETGSALAVAMKTGYTVNDLLPAGLDKPVWLMVYLAVAGVFVWLGVQGRMSREPRTTLSGKMPDMKPEGVGDGPGPITREWRRDGAQSDGLSATQVIAIDNLQGLKQINTSNISELLASVVYFMSRNFRAYSALGFIFDPGRQAYILNSYHSKSAGVIANVVIAPGDGIVGALDAKQQSFLSGDIMLYNRSMGYYSTMELVNSVLAVAIVSGQKELLGALVVDNKDKNAFNDRDLENLRRFSDFAAALITNVRMRFYQEQTARQLQVFYDASQRFTTTLKVPEVFDILLPMLPRFVHANRALAITFDEKNTEGIVRRVCGFSPEINEGFKFKVNQGLYAYAFQKKAVVNVPDMQMYRGKYYRFDENEPPNQSIRSLIILPFVDDEMRCLGLVSLESDRPDQYSGEVEPLLSTLIGNASVAFNRALLYQRMEMLATTDGLTGLSNHRHFQERLAMELERSRRYGKPVSLMLMDIDHFKQFNDTYGHPVGDLVLKEISACIRGSIRITDIPARYGGEEFVVVMPETGVESAHVTPERIRRNIEEHVIRSADRELHVTVSAGYATFPVTVKNQQELIDCADKALYYSKEHGRNKVTMYAEGMTGKE